MTTVTAPPRLAPGLRLLFRSGRAASIALVLGAAAIGVYYLLSGDAQAIWYEVIGAAAVSASAVGVLRNVDPADRLPWWLLTGGMLLEVGGDVVTAVYEVALGREPAVPSAADVFYLGGYPLLVCGAFALLRRRGSLLTQGGVLDAVIVFFAVGLAQWVFFIDPYNHDAGLSTAARLTGMAYPAMDALLLVALGQLMVGRLGRTRSYLLLLATFGLWIVADELYALHYSSYVSGSWIDTFWLASYVFWAAATLDPSVARIGRSGGEELPRLNWRRVALLAAALLIAPASLIVEKATHHHVHVSIGIFGALISIAVLLRLVGLIAGVEQARLAERDARREAEVAHRLLGFQNEQLRELDRLKDEFVSGVSHELRTPLTSISGYAELLLEDETDEARREHLRIIGRNSGRLLDLVSDVLFAARLQDGRLRLDFERVEVTALVLQAVEEAQPRARAAGIELTARTEAPAFVNGEPARLAQLLDNLVSNAVKFTPDGGRVEVGVAQVDGTLRVDVSDTGIGIAPEDRERLFERFFRSQSALERQIQGTGLGLYISKAIADAHGGRIGVASQEGKGTTFVVELPVADE